MLEQLASFQTPFYLYDLDLLKQTLDTCKLEAAQYGYHVHYALKANSNPEILRIISQSGIGADCVSGNEVKFAAAHGFPGEKIVFAGVGKTDREIEQALKVGISRYNVESIPELYAIQECAARLNVEATVNIRINPNVQSFTHANITTGLNENKFGVNLSDLKEVVKVTHGLSRVKLGGLHFHIGSQITRMEAFRNLCVRVNQINEQCELLGWKPDILNMGGGLGIDYVNPAGNPVPDFKTYFKEIHSFLEPKLHQEVHFELGRSLTGQMGKLISRVVFVKEGNTKSFLILDAGMTELMRPALYQAQHKILNLTREGDVESEKYDVVGPICESTDFFAKELSFQKSERNDLIAICSAGAYGESMANRYNLKELEPSQYVENGKFRS